MPRINPCSHLLLLVSALCTVLSCGRNSGSPAGPSTVSGTPRPTPPVAVDGRLAFVSTRDGARYIYVGDNTGVRQLAPGDRPAWSPDGTRIAFNSATGISVMNADGSSVRFLGPGGNPNWSPDATRIAFNNGDENATGIFVMNADGSGVSKLLDQSAVRSFSGGDCGVYWPAWSRDGRSIAFVCAVYVEPWMIYVMNADGSDPRRLIARAGDSRPIWVPDGQRLAFDAGGYTVGAVNVDGSGFRTMVVNAFWADWAVDGRIAFTRRSGPGPTALGGFETRIFAAMEGGADNQIIPDAVNPVAARYGDTLPSWAPQP